MHIIAVPSCQIVKSSPPPPLRRCWVRVTHSFHHRCPDSQQPQDTPSASLGSFFERDKYLKTKAFSHLFRTWYCWEIKTYLHPPAVQLEYFSCYAR